MATQGNRTHKTESTTMDPERRIDTVGGYVCCRDGYEQINYLWARQRHRHEDLCSSGFPVVGAQGFEPVVCEPVHCLVVDPASGKAEP